MAELFPVSRGEYDPSFAFDTSDVAPLDTSAFLPPPIKRSSPYPIGYNDATKQMFVNGETFDFDDHQSALDTREALKRPRQKMPQQFRPIEPDNYVNYINNIRDPSIGQLASKNFGIGVDNLQLLAGYGLQLAGAEDLGKGIVDQQLKDLGKNQPYQRAFTDLSVDKPGGIIDWFVANLAQQGPMLLESVLAAGAGAVIGGVTGGPAAALGGLVAGLGGKAGFKSAALAAAKKRASKQALTKAEKTLLGRVGGATLATAASNYGIGASDVYGEQLEGGTADRGTALALAIPYAVAETIPELLGAGLLFKGAKGGRLKRFGKGLALGSVGEGTTEFAQELITASQNPNLSDEEKSLRFINAFAAGAGVGGTITGLSLAARREQTGEQTGEQIPEDVADPLVIEPEGQLELFPDQDLGAAPIGLQEGQVQGELISDVRPVGPAGRPVDGEQLELDFLQEQGELDLVGQNLRERQLELLPDQDLGAAPIGLQEGQVQGELISDVRPVGPDGRLVEDSEQLELNLSIDDPSTPVSLLNAPINQKAFTEDFLAAQEPVTNPILGQELRRAQAVAERQSALDMLNQQEAFQAEEDALFGPAEQQLAEQQQAQSVLPLAGGDASMFQPGVTAFTPEQITEQGLTFDQLNFPAASQPDVLSDTGVQTELEFAVAVARAEAKFNKLNKLQKQNLKRTLGLKTLQEVRDLIQSDPLRVEEVLDNAKKRKAGAGRTAKTAGQKEQTGTPAQRERKTDGAEKLKKGQAKKDKDGSEESGPEAVAGGKQPASVKPTGTGAATLKRGTARKKTTEADTEDKKESQPVGQPITQPTERQDQQPDSVVIEPNYTTPESAWNALRSRADAGFRRKWHQFTAASKKGNASIDKAVADWKTAHKKYKETGELGSLIAALRNINEREELALSFPEEYRLFKEQFISDAAEPAAQRSALLDMMRLMLDPSVRNEFKNKIKTADDKALLQEFDRMEVINSSAIDRRLLDEALALYAEETLKPTGNGTLTIDGALAEFAVAIGAVDILLRVVENSGFKVGKVSPALEKEFDAVRVVEGASKVIANKSTYRASSLITIIEKQSNEYAHIEGLEGVTLNPEGMAEGRSGKEGNTFLRGQFTVAGQNVNELQALISGPNNVNLNYLHRGVPLKNWVDSKGMLKMKPVREGGTRFVIDTPDGATASVTEQLTDADAKPAEGRTSTWEGKPITKPISMGVLRMERIRLLKKFNSRLRPNAKIYTSVEALKTKDPKVYKEAMASRKDRKPIPTNAAGYAYSTTDANGRIRYKILLFQENIKNKQHARFVVAHEAIGHLGLRTIMSDQKFNRLMTDIYEADPAIRRDADNRMEFSGMKKLEAIEEAVADAAGYIESRFLVRLGDAIKTFLNKLGIRFSDDLTRYFIHQSRRYLRTGAVSDPSFFGIYNNMQELQRRHVEGRASVNEGLASTVHEQLGMIRPQTSGISAWLDKNDVRFKGIGVSSKISSLLGKGLELIQTLDNIMHRSPGMTSLYGVFSKQQEHIRDLQTVYNDLTKTSNKTSVLGSKDELTNEERNQANELLWKATLYKGQQLETIGTNNKPLYEQDIVIDGKVERLVNVVNGRVTINDEAKKYLEAKGQVTKQQFRNGFELTVYDNKGEIITPSDKDKAEMREKSKLDFEITDRVWTAYTEQRNAVNRAALDVYLDKVIGMTNARARHYAKMKKDYRLDSDATEILKNIGDIHSNLSSVGGRTSSAHKSVYQLIRVMHEQHGSKKMEDFFGDPANRRPADDEVIKEIQKTKEGRALIDQLPKLAKNKLNPPSLSRLMRGIMDTIILDAQLTDAELRAKQTIMAAYAPLKRRGKFQVRIVAFDKDGNPVKLDDRLRSMLSYIKTEGREEARGYQTELNKVLETVNLSADKTTFQNVKMLAENTDGRVDQDGLVEVSALKAVIEEVAEQPPLGGTINYDDVANTLMRAGIDLTPQNRRRLVELTASHHSTARRNLMRRNNPGFDTDMMRSIAEHLEVSSHIAGKNRYQHAIAEILADDSLWNGDPQKLAELQNNYKNAVASRNEASIFDTRKAMTQYQRMFVESTAEGDPFTIITPVAGDLLKTKQVVGKGKGNRYRSQATNVVRFYRETRNLMDATGEGVLGKFAQPLIGATAAAQLGGVIAPAIVNMTSLYTHALFYLATYNTKSGYGAGHGLGAATVEIHKAMSSLSLFKDGYKKDVFGTATSIQALIEQAKTNPNILKKYNIEKDELVFLENLTAKGVLTPNLANALVNRARTGRLSKTAVVTEAWMAMFSKTEQYNRRVTALASYRLEKARLKAQGADVTNSVNQKKLYQRATLAVNTSQGNYSQYNRPAWARGNLFQFLYMYKQFIVITVQLMRNLAPKEQMLLLTTLFLAAGLKGLPFGDDILDLLDTVAQILGIRWDGTEAELVQLVDEIAPGVSPIVMRGIIDHFTGLTVSSRLGHGDLIPGTGLFRAGADTGREIENVLGAPASFLVAAISTTSLAAKYAAETVGLRDDTTTLTDIGREGFGIAGIKSFTDGIVYLSDGEITNKRGQVVDKNATIVQGIARIFGFYPQSATLQYDVTRMSQQTADYAKELAASLRHAYVKADSAERREILQQVRRLQRQNRGTPFDLKNFNTSVHRATKEAERSASERSLRSLPKSTKSLAKNLGTAYGLFD